MKRMLQFLTLGVGGLVVLAACGQAEPAALVNNEGVPAAEVEAAVEVPSLEEAEDTTVEKAVVEAPAAVERDLTDVSYVANTGRPQFLNAFATW